MAERQKRLASTVNDPNDDLDDELDADLKRRRVAAVTAWRARQAMLLTCCAAAITVCHHAADVSARQRHDPIDWSLFEARHADNELQRLLRLDRATTEAVLEHLEAVLVMREPNHRRAVALTLASFLIRSPP
eukprot:m.430869 g.430869  ORF g.430869 m.430869 type:complete len:132 (-) comp81101_c0_seq1:29-424(-)